METTTRSVILRAVWMRVTCPRWIAPIVGTNPILTSPLAALVQMVAMRETRLTISINRDDNGIPLGRNRKEWESGRMGGGRVTNSPTLPFSHSPCTGHTSLLPLAHRVVVLDPVDLSACDTLKQGLQIFGILNEVDLSRIYDQKRGIFVMVKEMFVGFNQLVDVRLRYFGLEIEVAERNPLQQNVPRRL